MYIKNNAYLHADIWKLIFLIFDGGKNIIFAYSTDRLQYQIYDNGVECKSFWMMMTKKEPSLCYSISHFIFVANNI